LRYDDWDRGCASDAVRNGFLVPNIVAFLDQARPDSILDVGSLTGFMARTISDKLTYSPDWTLLDRDPAAIEYAKAKLPSGMKVRFANAPLETWDSSERFGAALLTFTLLEVQDQERTLKQIASRVGPNGHLLLALPDCLEDVIAEAESESSLEILHEFVQADVELPKVDKFTGEPYPFRARRSTRVISDTLAAGFALIDLIRDASISEGTFLMNFRRHAHA